MSLANSGGFSPTFDLNHCLSLSTKLIRAIGVSQIKDASLVISSYSFSALVSRT